jgi:hypothetical protein
VRRATCPVVTVGHRSEWATKPRREQIVESVLPLIGISRKSAPRRCSHVASHTIA